MESLPAGYRSDTVGYSIQPCWLLQFLLKPLLSRHVVLSQIKNVWFDTHRRLSKILRTTSMTLQSTFNRVNKRFYFRKSQLFVDGES